MRHFPIHPTTGQAFVPISYFPTTRAWDIGNVEAESRGFNLLPVESADTEHFRGTLPNNSVGFLDFKLRVSSVLPDRYDEDDWDAIASMYASHPQKSKIIFAKLDDEPFIHGVTITEFLKFVAYIRKIVPGLKIWFSNSDYFEFNSFIRYARGNKAVGADYVSKSWYGIQTGWHGTSADVGTTGGLNNVLAKSRNAIPGKGSSWATLQALAWSATQDGITGNTPTLAELRWQVEVAFKQGATGICWFGPHTWYDVRDNYGYARTGWEGQPAATLPADIATVNAEIAAANWPAKAIDYENSQLGLMQEGYAFL